MWSSHPSHPFSTVVDVLWTSLDQEAGLGLSEAQRLWDECAGLLRAQVSEPVWLTQFDDARAVALTDDTLTVAVTSFLAKERIEGRYLSLVRDALNELGAANKIGRASLRARVVQSVEISGVGVSVKKKQ